MRSFRITLVRAVPFKLSFILLSLTPFVMDAEQLTLTDKNRLCIEQMEYRYNYAIDIRDWKSLANCFAPEGSVTMNGSGATGRSAIAKWFDNAFKGSDANPGDAMDYCRHVVVPGELKYDGNSVSQQSVILEFVALKDGKSKFFSGTYDDQWVRTPEGWRLKQRNIHLNPPILGLPFSLVRVRDLWLRPDSWADRGEQLTSPLDPNEWDNEQVECAISLVKSPTSCLPADQARSVKAVYCPRLDFRDRTHGQFVFICLLHEKDTHPEMLSLVQFVIHLEKRGDAWLKSSPISIVDLQGKIPPFFLSSVNP